MEIGRAGDPGDAETPIGVPAPGSQLGLIHSLTSAAMHDVNPPSIGGVMKRRFFALLAVPALALGFAFASPATDQAQAIPPIPTDWVCSYVGQKMAEAEYYGNVSGYIYWADMAEELHCVEDLTS
jgi:hypothetical protein